MLERRLGGGLNPQDVRRCVSFFFSSRRRHTRCSRDWSSDVCSSDLKLAPGLYDAGEATMGMKHLALVRKPDAFQLGASDPDDPKVQKVIGQMGIGNKIGRASCRERV